MEICKVMSKTKNRVQWRARAVLLSKAQVRGNYKAELVQIWNKEVT